ncbi:Negative regulator of mitotic exit, partial [Tulasnella sp. 417]
MPSLGSPLSFFRRRKASVQVQDSQAALVHQQQQQQVIQEQQPRRQQQQASATDRDAQAAREREMEQQGERIERERERLALRRETAQREQFTFTNQQQQQMWSQAPQQRQLSPPPPPREREPKRGPLSSQQTQQQSQSQGSGGHKPSPTGRPAYPWSARRLAIQPVSPLRRQPGPPVQSPSPFPRYGHSLPLTSTNNGELFLFGGLVKEQITNDLYSFSTRDHSVALIETKGAAPPPRVGHASALIGSVLIVWGGDTKTSPSESRDDALYFLNLGTMDWTRVSTPGRAPAG